GGTPVSAIDLVRMNSAPPELDPARDLPRGFAAWYAALHAELSPRQKALARARIERLARAHEKGALPEHRPPSPATTRSWRTPPPAPGGGGGAGRGGAVSRERGGGPPPMTPSWW